VTSCNVTKQNRKPKCKHQKSKTSRRKTINTKSLATCNPNLKLELHYTTYLNTLIRFSGLFLANTSTYFLRLGEIKLQVFEKIKKMSGMKQAWVDSFKWFWVWCGTRIFKILFLLGINLYTQVHTRWGFGARVIGPRSFW
jgi:hypothetical protein